MNAQTQPNRYAPPQAEVADAVVDDEVVEPADRGARLGAAILDFVIYAAMFLPVFVSIGFDFSAVGQPGQVSGAAMGLTFMLLLGLLIYTIILVQANGQTVGKKLVGIKVVRSDGSKASLGRIFWLRNVVNAIPSAIPFVGTFYVLIDSLFIFTEKRQCLHDKIADTIVVNA